MSSVSNVARAHEAGALRSDVTAMDISLLIGQFSRLPPAPPGQAPHLRERLLGIAIDGLHPTTTRLPPPAPDPDAYGDLWQRGGDTANAEP